MVLIVQMLAEVVVFSVWSKGKCLCAGISFDGSCVFIRFWMITECM
jgi:lipid-binding SYLF domain-containing protein